MARHCGVVRFRTLGVGQIVAFRSAKGMPFAERKATIHRELRMLRRVAPWLTVLALIVSMGCHGESKSKLIPVNGTVTLNGEPLADGVIYFKTIQTGAVEGFVITD